MRTYKHEALKEMREAGELDTEMAADTAWDAAGFDSTAMAALVTNLEEGFGRKLEPTVLKGASAKHTDFTGATLTVFCVGWSSASRRSPSSKPSAASWSRTCTPPQSIHRN